MDVMAYRDDPDAELAFRILVGAPYRMPWPTARVVCSWWVRQSRARQGRASFSRLLSWLQSTSDRELLEVDGLGPASVRQVRRVLRQSRRDPWLAHAEMAVAAGD